MSLLTETEELLGRLEKLLRTAEGEANASAIEAGRWRSAYENLKRDYDEALANLTATQALCTAQLEELRHYRRSGICLPGWHCRKCGAFNGSAREVREECRACGEKK